MNSASRDSPSEETMCAVRCLPRASENLSTSPRCDCSKNSCGICSVAAKPSGAGCGVSAGVSHTRAGATTAPRMSLLGLIRRKRPAD